MEWIVNTTDEPMNDLNSIDNYSFCVFRLCSNKKNCSDYTCIILLTKTSHTPNGTCSLKIQYFS